MSKKTIAVLSSLIASMMIIIVVSVHYLYSGPIDDEKFTVVEPSEDSSLNLPDEAVDAPVIVPDVVADAGTSPDVADSDATVANKAATQGKASAPADKASAQEKTPAAVAAEKTPAPAKVAQSESKKTPAGVQTFTVKNSGTGKQNILRQNADNSIELIDEKGKSLWKKSLSGKICGSVAQVDHLGNGKIQYLMAEGTRLHLIDRLGREVGGFPMNLPAKAQKGPYAAQAKGQNCWKVVTATGSVYYDKKVTKVVATAAK